MRKDPPYLRRYLGAMLINRLGLGIVLSVLLVATSRPAVGQGGLGLGQWRPQSGYNGLYQVAITGQAVYAAAPFGMFRYELSTGQLGPVSKVEGLTRTDIAALAWAPSPGTLVVAYQDGNLDLIDEGRGPAPGRIRNIPALARATLTTTSRQVRDIYIDGQTAYLGGDYGLIVIDIPTGIVRASNTVLDVTGGGAMVAVRSLTVWEGRLWLATAQGVLSVPTGANLQDTRQYRNEVYSPASGLPSEPTRVRSLRAMGGALYLGFTDIGFYAKSAPEQLWQPAPGMPGGLLRSVNRAAIGDSLLVSHDDRVSVCGPGGVVGRVVRQPPLTQEPTDARQGANGTIWLAEPSDGLVELPASGAEGSRYLPNGPRFDLPLRLKVVGRQIFSLPGGYAQGIYSQLNRTIPYSIYEQGRWTTHPPLAGRGRPVADLASVARSPETGRLWFASYGAGVLEQLGTDSMRVISDTTRQRDGNRLVSSLPTFPGLFVRTSQVSFDRAGTMWVINNAPGSPPFHRYDGQGQWSVFDATPQNRDRGLDLLFDDFGLVWMRMGPGQSSFSSIICLDPSVPGGRTGIISLLESQGRLPSPDVYDYALDREGALWMATGKGVAVLYNPFDVLSGQSFQATLPIFEGRPLLEDDIVTAMALDGGERKWFGTRRSGVWLFDRSLTRVIVHFTEDNSPLPSDNITDIAIEPVTGEVFIATDRGIISYGADASTSPERPTNQTVRVYPNPVRPGFRGPIAVAGLPANATVKIIDPAGRLVFETQANGGTASWNGLDGRGRRAAPGVYGVLAATEGETSGVVAKIIMIE